MASVTAITLDTLKSYKKMAENPSGRSVLLKDSACLSFLVYVLDDECMDVVEMSVQILLLLTEKLSHRHRVKELSSVGALTSLLNNKDFPDSLRPPVDTLLERLTSQENRPLSDLRSSAERGSLISNEKCGNSNSMSVPDKEWKTDSNIGSACEYKKPGLRFISGVARKSQCLTFQLYGGCLTKENQTIIESELLKIRGIISIYFDFSRNRCIVRAKLEVTPEVVTSAILRTQLYSVQQVTKDEAGEEILIPVCDDSNKNPENVDGLDYLNESFGESPHRNCSDPEKILVTADHHRRNRRDSVGGLWENIASFFSSSFYW